MLDARGGFRSDLTVMRLAHDRYRVVTGGAARHGRQKWFADLMPADGTAQVVDLTSAYTTIGLWGPRARDILGTLTDDDISHEGFPFLTLPRHRGRQRCRCSPRGSPTSASWAGSCTCRWSRAPGCGTLLHEAGRQHGAVPAGIGVYGTTGRIEKGYRAFGFELDTERTIVEAGMQRPKVKAADFVGREAYLKQRDGAPAGRAVHDDRRRPHVGSRACSASCSAASRS